MKRLFTSFLVTLLSVGLLTAQVEAKPLGGGRTSGMKRQAPPPQPTTPATPAQPVPAKPAATPGTPAAATAPAATPPKRSWMGPLAGLAAGLGIAALLSHFGMGEGLSSFITILLVAGLAFFALRFLLQRFGPGRQASGASGLQGMAYAGAGAGAGAGAAAGLSGTAPAFPPRGHIDELPGATGSSALASPAAAGSIPLAGVDTAALERAAKLIFIRMQAANDAGNLDDLRQFSTPEMFANFRLDLQDRHGAPQQTDVVQLTAQVVDVAQEGTLQIVSVRFQGLMREDRDAPALPFDETWHLVRPQDGSREWAIAGIAQNAA